MAATIIHDSSEAVELCCSRRLFLKPISKLAITVMWPDLVEPTKTVSNWEVMAKLKQMAHPLQFTSIRVSKSTLDFVRFEAELETKALGKSLCQKLNGRRLDGMAGGNTFRVVTSEAGADFPTRKEWESFFQDQEEWPDTLYLDGLPCKWFSTADSQCQKPREEIVQEVFQKFGPIRNMDIPALDMYREETGNKLSSAFSVTGLQTFDVYLQFQRHKDVRNAMETLRGMRLMLKESDGKALVCNIKVNLDLTDHFSEAAVQKRFLERKQLEALEEKRQREKRYEREEEANRKRREEQRAKRREEKLRRRAERQEEAERRAADIQAQEEEEQLWEERKFVLVQRRLQSIRLLSALLHRVCIQQVTKKVQCVKKFIKKEERLSGPHSSPLHDASEELKMKPKQGSASAPKKLKVCPYDSTIPDLFTEYLCDDKPVPTHEHLRKNAQFGPLQITISQGHAKRDLAEHSWPPTGHHLQSCSTLSGSFPSGKNCFSMPKEREKVYESEEFVNYILNHYPHPCYARTYQNLQSLSHKDTGWRRMVSDDGKGFQISLRNLDGGICTEVSICQNLDQHSPSDEDGYKWKITIKETEPVQNTPVTQRGLRGGYSREFEVSWNDSSSKNKVRSMEMQKSDQDIHLRRGTFVVKNIGDSGHEELSKNIAKPVSLPPSILYRQCHSGSRFPETGKVLQSKPEDSDDDTKAKDWKYHGYEKRASQKDVCWLGKKDRVFEEQIEAKECEPQKVRSGSSTVRQLEKKKTKKFKKCCSGDQCDETEDRKKRKAKREKYREDEYDNEKVMESLPHELKTWGRRFKDATPLAGLYQTHSTLSYEYLDTSSEPKGNRDAVQDGECKSSRKSCSCGCESSNWTCCDKHFTCVAFGSNSKGSSLGTPSSKTKCDIDLIQNKKQK